MLGLKLKKISRYLLRYEFVVGTLEAILDFPDCGLENFLTRLRYFYWRIPPQLKLYPLELPVKLLTKYSIILLVNFKFLSLLILIKDGIGVFNINLLLNPGFDYSIKEYNYLLV